MTEAALEATVTPMKTITMTTAAVKTAEAVMTTGADGKYAISHRFTISKYASNRMIMISFDWHSLMHTSMTQNGKIKTD